MKSITTQNYNVKFWEKKYRVYIPFINPSWNSSSMPYLKSMLESKLFSSCYHFYILKIIIHRFKDFISQKDLILIISSYLEFAKKKYCFYFLAYSRLRQPRQTVQIWTYDLLMLSHQFETYNLLDKDTLKTGIIW